MTNDSDEECEANAALICEAFNVTHETGKTPKELADLVLIQERMLSVGRKSESELAERVKELEALIEAMPSLYATQPNWDAWYELKKGIIK